MNEKDVSSAVRALEAQAWSRYWASGALHSCPTTFTGNYGAEIRDLWAEFFTSLPGGARILDIGTGNGAVALIARDVSAQNGSTMEIEAIDLAEIQPALAASAYGLNLDGITFRSAVAAEETGYPDCWFDVVTGHYALEYTRTADTVRELARITKPGALLLFVLHHADSGALVPLRHELESFDYIDHQVPLLALSRRFLKRLSTATNPRDLQRLSTDSESREQMRELEHVVGQVVARAKSRPDTAVLTAIASQVTTIMRELRSLGPTASLQRLNHLGEEMLGHRDRLRALTRASLTTDDMKRLEGEFKGARFTTERPTELKLRGKDLVGWILRARREA